jgi:hypothetical protein
MKYLFFYSIPLLLIFGTNKFTCDKLPNGKYLVHFTLGSTGDYKIRITDSSFVQYFNNGDSVKGKIHWIHDCDFRMEYCKKDKTDTLSATLKLVYDSWGEPYIELNEVKKDSIKFRTTYPRNLHITANEGYFIKITEL